MALKTNSKAPNFKLKGTSDLNFELKNNLPCIIYFYPKDFTSGCTAEACSFRDGFEELRDLDIAVFGISRDSIESHEKFKAKHQLPFELLSDEKGNVCKAYDALIPIVKIPKRITYLIDSEGKIKASYSDMFDGKSHLKQMITEVQSNK